jgi:hypothetical protein
MLRHEGFLESDGLAAGATHADDAPALVVDHEFRLAK